MNGQQETKRENLRVGKNLSDFLLRGDGKPAGFALWTGLISLGIAWWAPDTYSTLGRGSARGWLVFFLIIACWTIFGAGVAYGESGKDVSIIVILAPLFVVWAAFFIDVVRTYLQIKTQAQEFETSANNTSTTETDKAIQAMIVWSVRRDRKKAKEMLSRIDWKNVNPEIKKKLGV